MIDREGAPVPIEAQVRGSPARFLDQDDVEQRIPVHVVWELTLACDLKCLHCGSRAGRRRSTELSTEECLETVAVLAGLGTREISLIGGEAYLRSDWVEIVRAIRSYGIYCGLQTGGRNLTRERLQDAAAAGLNGVGVSVDGMERLHEKLRGVRGCYRSALDTLRHARELGLRTSVNTQIGAETMSDLPPLMEVIAQCGATHWQLQLTVPMGNAADSAELVLQPHQLLELMPLLARLYREALDRNILMTLGNNIGYFGPYEHVWRGFGDESVHWTGCSAGRNVLAIEADGTVKGCPSLATTDYGGGNVRQLSLDRIWRSSPRITAIRPASSAGMWGFCQTCYYADVCSGGCTWMAHSLFGRAGNNPFCHYRALKLAAQGLRERVVKVEEASNAPFAVGKFALLLEQADGRPVAFEHPAPGLTHIAPAPVQEPAASGSSPAELTLCGACRCYIRKSEVICPHCGKDVAESARERDDQAARRREAQETLESALAAAIGYGTYRSDRERLQAAE